MKFKFKINENTKLEDIRQELDNLKKANVTHLPYNHLRKIIEFLGSVQVSGTGSSIRFKNELLNKHPYYHGFFQIHKKHKGGNQDEISITDFKMILYPALIEIIEQKTP
jgi:hypothetical protein